MCIYCVYMYRPTVYTYICTGRPVTSSVSVWALNAERWGQVAKLEIESVGKGVGSEVRDVDWAPSMGRPYYFIAAAVGSTVQVVCIHTHTHTHTHTPSVGTLAILLPLLWAPLSPVWRLDSQQYQRTEKKIRIMMIIFHCRCCGLKFGG